MSLKLKLVIAAVILVAVGLGIQRILATRPVKITYQTAVAQKDNLISSVSASGNVTAGGNVAITTSATGLVAQVYVKKDESVVAGQKLASLTLDQTSQAKQASAWASYLGAKNSADSASNNLHTLQAAEFAANQKFINDAVARNLPTNDPTYIQENATWLAAEANYKNQTTAIAQSQSALTSSWLNYLQTSNIITAPASGIVKSITLAPGLAIGSQTISSSSTSTANVKVGDIALSGGHTQATVSLSEIDAPKVSPGMKVTMSLDAFPDKTFTGVVLVVDTTGQASSGVITYPATIIFDSAPETIYPNMAVSATIITKIENDVLLVPTSAIKTINGQTSVQIMKNHQPSTVMVETGDTNDSEIVIISGLSEGDVVVTGSTSTTRTTSTNATTSPFSAFGGGGNRTFGSVRVQGR